MSRTEGPTLREQVSMALETHKSSDERERGFVERMKSLARGVEDPFSRASFEPGHFTASAFVLSPCGGRLLLILHSKLDLWLQPGGHIDETDSSLVDAARREAQEETGLRGLRTVPSGAGLFDVDIHPIPANRKKAEPAHEHFDLRFLFVSESSELRAGSDALAARWVPLDEVTDAGTDDSVLRALRKIAQAEQRD